MGSQRVGHDWATNTFKEKQAVLLNLTGDIPCGTHVHAALGVTAMDIRLRGISSFSSSPGNNPNYYLSVTDIWCLYDCFDTDMHKLKGKLLIHSLVSPCSQYISKNVTLNNPYLGGTLYTYSMTVRYGKCVSMPFSFYSELIRFPRVILQQSLG